MMRAARLTGAAEEIVVAALDDADVQPAAHAQRDAVGSAGIGQRLLECSVARRASSGSSNAA